MIVAASLQNDIMWNNGIYIYTQHSNPELFKYEL